MAQTQAQGLRTNYLPFPAVLSQSVGCIGPSPAAAIAPSLIFATAGNGTWLSIVIAGAGSILVAMTIVYFARSIASSGSFYAYAASSLGPVGGIMAAWGLLLAYLLTAPAATVVFGVYSTKTFSLRDSPGLLIAIYVVLACMNAASRMLYTMGRDGLLPAALGRAHPKYRTPYIALAVCAVPTILLPVALAVAGVRLEDVLGYLGTWGEYGFLVAYPIISVAAGFYLHKTGKLKPINVLVCTLATALMLFVFAGQLYPIPPFPYNIFPYLLLGYLAIGLLWCLYLYLRRPQLLARAGKGFSSGDDLTPNSSHGPAREGSL